MNNYTFMKRIFLVGFLTALSFTLNAQRGKDGTPTFSGTQVVNAYTSLTSDAAAGNTVLTVANSSLNSNFPSSLGEGDLILIIQVQGTSVEDTTSSVIVTDDSRFNPTWGKILNYNNCGNHELVQVASVSNATTINLDCGLQFDYTASGKVVVVRVPRYENLTIDAGVTLTAEPWNGSTGGILAIEVKGTTTINGNIDVSEIGFRGGQPENASTFGGGRYASTDAIEGGEKGEGIAGDWSFYDANLHGRYCRGAAANAGGGGTAHNAGGGGGANAGNILNWQNGIGVPDPAYNGPWSLETPSIAFMNASGGGRGGYSYASSDENELTKGPGHPDWSGDLRREMGGLGGRPLDYSTGKIFMGGAGGAGDGNSSPLEAGAGGNGGGIIFISSYNDVSGSGTISANGQAGFNSGTTAIPPLGSLTGKDAAGGAGAGGTVIIKTVGTVSNLTISANGGSGGRQILRSFFATNNEAEGPGGGGGGGYIALSAGTPTRSAVGGANGTTDSPIMTNFPPNGATSGGDGMPNESVDAFDFSISGTTTICANTTTTLTTNIIGTPPSGASVEWYDAEIGGNLVFSGNPFITPSLTTNTTFYASICPAPYRVSVGVTVDPCASITASFESTDSILCVNDCINFSDISAGAPTSWTWYFPGSSSPSSSQQNPFNICYNTPGSFPVSLVVNDGANSDSLYLPNFITVFTQPNSGANGIVEICPNAASINLFDSLGGIPDTGGTWSPALVSGTSVFDPVNDSSNRFVYSVTNSCGTSINNVDVTVLSLPNSGSDSNLIICPTDPTTDLFNYLGGTPDPGGTWSPALTSGTGVIDPATDLATTYTYTVTNLCGSTTSNIIVSQTNCNLTPIASLNTANPSTCNDNCIDFTAMDTGGAPTSWSWHFFGANPSTSNSSNPLNICYSTTGYYDVALTVSNIFGSDSVFIANYIFVDSCTTDTELTVPNVFSPNGDNNNDVFKVSGTNIISTNIKIYNSWGSLVYNVGRLINNGWDGRTNSGTECPEGTYFYIIEITNGIETDILKGTLTLVR